MLRFTIVLNNGGHERWVCEDVAALHIDGGYIFTDAEIPGALSIPMNRRQAHIRVYNAGQPTEFRDLFIEAVR